MKGKLIAVSVFTVIASIVFFVSDWKEALYVDESLLRSKEYTTKYYYNQLDNFIIITDIILTQMIKKVNTIMILVERSGSK